MQSRIYQKLGCYALLALLACGSMPAHASPEVSPAGSKTGQAAIVAAGVTVETDGPKTRFKIILSKPVTAKAHLMERPDRVIVDLPEVSFHLPPETGQKREGVIASFRYGLFAPGQSRVVMDLAQTAVVSDIRAEASNVDGASTLVIELTRAEREEYRRAVAESAKQRINTPTAQPAEASTEDTRPIIVLDPGHGGVDPGAASLSGTFEKEIVLTFAQRLKKRLEESGRYRVVMTRDEDTFLSLEERVKFAKGAKADLFMSIHADSLSGHQEDVRGMTVYTRAERASDAESARVADRENKADTVAGIDATEGPDEILDILQDLTLRETRAFSSSIAGGLVKELEPVARMNKNSRREARFWVLRAHDVPSVLLELGYLSSKKDYDLLVSDEWRGKATGAIMTAVDRFFATRLAKQGAAAVLP